MTRMIHAGVWCSQQCVSRWSSQRTYSSYTLELLRSSYAPHVNVARAGLSCNMPPQTGRFTPTSFVGGA